MADRYGFQRLSRMFAEQQEEISKAHDRDPEGPRQRLRELAADNRARRAELDRRRAGGR
jgi:hypothetical protein